MGNQGAHFFPPVLQKEPQIQLPITRNLRRSDDVMTWGCAGAAGGGLQKNKIKQKAAHAATQSRQIYCARYLDREEGIRSPIGFHVLRFEGRLSGGC